LRRHLFERHYVSRVTWLRAAVLGANDGIVSVASLLLGVASGRVSRHQTLLIGIAGLVAGAMSMSAGEFVSVSSQADSERSDLERERHELEADESAERAELAGIYIKRGLRPSLAQEVATQLMAHDALGAHARDELGIVASQRARPLQAALASAASFAIGAVVPLLAVLLAPASVMPAAISASSLLFLAILGGASARAGGAPMAVAIIRVTFWGALAMVVTAAIGLAFGAFA
jgi:VIT1/CCC1 family predicted Fe2+/Mn2+ transporter